jgi:hypothetical protein
LVEVLLHVINSVIQHPLSLTACLGHQNTATVVRNSTQQPIESLCALDLPFLRKFVGQNTPVLLQHLLLSHSLLLLLLLVLLLLLSPCLQVAFTALPTSCVLLSQNFRSTLTPALRSSFTLPVLLPGSGTAASSTSSALQRRQQQRRQQ